MEKREAHNFLSILPKSSGQLSLSGLFAFLIVALTAGEPFFWDTIQLGARHADWFYTQNFAAPLLPDHMDSGHVPAFGAYLALGWKLFGKNLAVSHFLLLPWTWLVVNQVILLARKFQLSKNKLYIFSFIAVLLLDATLTAQLTLISPDVVLMGAFLLGLNAIYNPRRDRVRRVQLGLAVLLLGLVSLRGMMVACGLFLWQLSLLYQGRQLTLRAAARALLPYLLGGLPAMLYLGYHYAVKGWAGTHADSPWAASFAGAGGLSLVKQAGIVVWRLLDFGRIFLYLALCLAWWRSGRAWTAGIRAALALILILGSILALPAIISPGLAQHRYLLPVYLGAGWLFLQVLVEVRDSAWRHGLIALVLCGQLTGHLWVYPPTVAQGWDASLAHKPYFTLRAEGLRYLQDNDIPLENVGTTFPDLGPLDWRDLSSRLEGFHPYDLNSSEYIWHSNIHNDFTDADLRTLRENWTPVFHARRGGVFLYIYRKN